MPRASRMIRSSVPSMTFAMTRDDKVLEILEVRQAFERTVAFDDLLEREAFESPGAEVFYAKRAHHAAKDHGAAECLGVNAGALRK